MYDKCVYWASILFLVISFNSLEYYINALNKEINEFPCFELLDFFQLLTVINSVIISISTHIDFLLPSG
jgi:hypothetical protein